MLSEGLACPTHCGTIPASRMMFTAGRARRPSLLGAYPDESETTWTSWRQWLRRLGNFKSRPGVVAGARCKCTIQWAPGALREAHWHEPEAAAGPRGRPGAKSEAA